MEVMLGAYSKNELDSNQEDSHEEVDLESNGPQQAVNPNSKDFNSLLNTNSGENSKNTIETTRLINFEITIQVTTKLDEIEI